MKILEDNMSSSQNRRGSISSRGGNSKEIYTKEELESDLKPMKTYPEKVNEVLKVCNEAK